MTNNTSAHYTDLAHNITVIDAEYMADEIAAIYLIEQQGEVAIIETGTNHSLPFIQQVLTQKGLSYDNVRYIIPTHVHLDHAGGASGLMAVCPNAELVIHPFGAAHMIDPSKLIAGASAVYGEEKFKQLYGEIKPIDKQRVIEADDGFSLSLNGRRLEFLDTPGHARHHFCVYDEQSKGIFSGDTFGLSYPHLTTDAGRFIFATTTPVQFDPQALLSSIEKLLAKQPERMYLTHFSEIEPTANVVSQLTDSVKAFENIALEAKAVTENRTEVINQQIQDYLLKQLSDMGCHQDLDTQRKVIQFDSLLNAQGLDFWLSKYHA